MPFEGARAAEPRTGQRVVATSPGFRTLGNTRPSRDALGSTEHVRGPALFDDVATIQPHEEIAIAHRAQSMRDYQYGLSATKGMNGFHHSLLGRSVVGAGCFFEDQ